MNDEQAEQNFSLGVTVRELLINMIVIVQDN